jgi:predicted Zn-dependent peptidase
MNSGLLWNRQMLPNGLTVLQYPRQSAMTAQLSVLIKYGSTDDGSDKIGCAHFLEHMLVGGSQKRIKLHHEIERLGGCSGFETTYESTFTWVNTFADRIAACSRVLADLLLDDKFENDKLEIERKIILNEIAEAEDDPRHKAEQALIKNLFKKNPIRNLVSGTKKEVKNLTIENIEKAHFSQYTPENMVIILTGRYYHEDANNIISYFQHRENIQLTKKQRLIEQTKPRRQMLIKRSGISQAYLSFGFRTPPARDKDTTPLSLINSILGIGESSRLFIELRERRALTYDYCSSNNTGLDYGYFVVACAVKDKLLKKTQDIIKSELKKLTTTPVIENELEKSKNSIIADIARGIDSPQELPRIMADTEQMFSNEKELSQFVEKIKQLTKHDIMETAQKYFKEENYSTAVLTPK